MSGFRLSLFTPLKPTPCQTPPNDKLLARDTAGSKTCESVGPRLPVIALTGGPCGGKSTLLKQLKQPEALGSQTHVMPVNEIPTQLESYLRSAQKDIATFEASLVKTQCDLENFWLDHIPSTQGRSVMICDRGALDASAYCEPQVWQHILADRGETEADLCNRYDYVLHITSAAVDAPEHYHHQGDMERLESIDEAVALDKTLAKAWAKHPNREVLDNHYASFDAKMAAGRGMIERFLEGYHAASAHDSAFASRAA